MSILDTFSNPSMMHAAVVHLPIALAMLGTPIALVCALWAFKTQQKLPSIIVLICYLLLTVTAFIGEETGEEARTKVPPNASQEVWNVLEEHESKAEMVKLAGAITAFFFLLTFLPGESFRNWMWIMGLTGSTLTLLLITFAAHDGGALVYQYGVGTPHMEAGDGDGGEAAVPEEELVPIREIDLEAAALVDYERDIWPMVEQYCIDCHEPDEPDGDYDMSTIETMMLAGEKAGPGIIPGNPDESSIIQYIRGELKPRMPKKDPPLSEDELHLFRSWIAAMAPQEAAPAKAPAAEEEASFDPFAAPAEEEAPKEETSFDPFAATTEPAPVEEETAEAVFDPFS